MSPNEKEIASLDQETRELNAKTEELNAQLSEKREATRIRLLEEFGECFSDVYALCDDYGDQESRFIRSFSTMRDEGYLRLQAIMDECGALGGKENE